MNTFHSMINAEQTVLVDFFASWCGPCKMMSPILEKTKAQLGDRVRIIKVDVDKNPHVAAQYQVRGVPTLIAFKSGQIKWRQSGIVSETDLIAVLKGL